MANIERGVNGAKRHELERGTLNAFAALVASEHGLPGVPARIRKPKNGHGPRFVEVQTTSEGDNWLTRLREHPYMHALTLMFDAQRIERELERGEAEMTKIEAHKKRHNITGLKENAAKLLGDGALPTLGDDTIKGLLSVAVTDLTTPA